MLESPQNTLSNKEVLGSFFQTSYRIDSQEKAASFTGTIPYILEGRFPKFGGEGKKPFKAVAIKPVNEETTKTQNFDQIIKDKRLIVLQYHQGVIKVMNVHSNWVETIKKEFANEPAIEVMAFHAGTKQYGYVQERFKMVQENDQGYAKIVKHFCFKI